MGAVVEDIAGCGIDWDGASICRRVCLLTIGKFQSGASECHLARDDLPSMQLQCLKFLR